MEQRKKIVAVTKRVVAQPKISTEANRYVPKVLNRIKVKIKADSAQFIPTYAHADDACCDLRANLPDGPLTIGVLETVKIDAGFSMQMPPGYEAQIRPRSSMGAKAIIMPNSIGTIDSPYTGRICVLLTNLSKEPFVVNHFDRIAQMAIKPVYYFDFEEVDSFETTERGDGGFGSTGTN